MVVIIAMKLSILRSSHVAYPHPRHGGARPHQLCLLHQGCLRCRHVHHQAFEAIGGGANGRCTGRTGNCPTPTSPCEYRYISSSLIHTQPTLPLHVRIPSNVFHPISILSLPFHISVGLLQCCQHQITHQGQIQRLHGGGHVGCGPAWVGRWEKATTKWTETLNALSSSSSAHMNAHEYSPSNLNAHATAQPKPMFPYWHPVPLGLHLWMSRNRRIWLRPLHRHCHRHRRRRLLWQRTRRQQSRGVTGGMGEYECGCKCGSHSNL